MVKKPYVFDPETPLTRALQKMIETGHKNFPVVENDRVLRIIAREDVLRALRRSALGQFPTRLRQSDIEGIGKAGKLY